MYYIINEKAKANSPENITSTELGKRSKQAKKVYFLN